MGVHDTIGIDELCRRHHRHPMAYVLQLANVSRPAMRLQHRHGVVADRAHGQAAGRRQALHEMADQHRNVVAPFGQEAATLVGVLSGHTEEDVNPVSAPVIAASA